ncbi:MAG: hypothetical protein A2066_10045 [Bacteroidetes bacterium GWB2_41_8]|nr:MAG: hypothetical protein A2066_10045 [Bacteroidetes bacterium GWB2_41_8]
MSDSWSNIEVELIVADYFNMLSSELKGEAYSKAVHRRALLPLLANRSDGSIEFKHQNISAVLINLGQPYIKGYLPRFNYQKILEDKVIEYLIRKPAIESQFKVFAEKPILQPKKEVNFEKFIFDLPVLAQVSEPEAIYKRNPIKINYLEREQNNRNLGNSGEELVIEYEKWHLIKSGKEKFAEQIRWISKEDGDGAGFDILSKQLNGKDKYIEVKTTKLGKETPFYFSSNELDFSQQHSDNFHLYRLFNFEDDAKMFIRNGGLDAICHVTPINFRGVVKG